MRRALALLLLAAGSLRADGWTYRYTTRSEGGVAPYTRSGTAWVDGSRARVEIASDVGRVATIRDAAKDTCTNLDLERKTFYETPCSKAFTTASGVVSGFDLGRVPVPGASAAVPKRDRIVFEEKDLGPGAEVSGLATRGTSFTVSWRERTRIGPDTVSLDIARTLEVWTSDRVRQGAFSFGHADGLAVVPDEERPLLAKRLAEIGYPLRLVVVLRRKFDKGEPATETRTTILEDVRPTAVDAALFEVPKGFRHEEPLIGIPSQ